MAKFTSWLVSMLKFLAFGLVLSLGIRLAFRAPLARAFEYSGAFFFVLSIIIFITRGPKKEKGLAHSDVYYVVSFGLVGFILLLLPLVL